MEESTIEKLRKQESAAVVKRAQLKREIRVITKSIYNIRQKIKYLENRQGQKPNGRLFEMFGKTRAQLTQAELREYNNALRKIRKNNAKSRDISQ